ncbi:hypothetical protein [Amnibacterium endophyticum]|uniref:Uncharacterized protein n=1 Tax=Amnibacterium endophyticum TaxID=2109337 RepID=A0ABW4LFB7_9MICO
MRGAPWDGLFYGFVLLALVLVGALTSALEAQDFLFRALAWAVTALCVAGMVRILRRAIRLQEPDRPTGRWWFGG